MGLRRSDSETRARLGKLIVGAAVLGGNQAAENAVKSKLINGVLASDSKIAKGLVVAAAADDNYIAQAALTNKALQSESKAAKAVVGVAMLDDDNAGVQNVVMSHTINKAMNSDSKLAKGAVVVAAVDDNYQAQSALAHKAVNSESKVAKTMVVAAAVNDGAAAENAIMSKTAHVAMTTDSKLAKTVVAGAALNDNYIAQSAIVHNLLEDGPSGASMMAVAGNGGDEDQTQVMDADFKDMKLSTAKKADTQTASDSSPLPSHSNVNMYAPEPYYLVRPHMTVFPPPVFSQHVQYPPTTAYYPPPVY
ncbi:hypothetical protein SARC_00986 [Sphaeroforma arctica JP610]|uniref:Uncharacterized protein n=1 Tax=Sphaeroforma arctica JP610 TaxID=667725 RepID=A0A0L0GDD0_9EUKA|nr:hypothetical protein SARC_00986 [Sphaeroforma arctica JP610]KNC86891.1 hypothetical protein SARC_00986 [Sphaeroforma arctica JP610]|eukprot:XP_014160793.1 hypothetical protein SARC_00986 [Sphaeroforma arctica JP610]